MVREFSVIRIIKGRNLDRKTRLNEFSGLTPKIAISWVNSLSSDLGERPIRYIRPTVSYILL